MVGSPTVKGPGRLLPSGPEQGGFATPQLPRVVGPADAYRAGDEEASPEGRVGERPRVTRVTAPAGPQWPRSVLRACRGCGGQERAARELPNLNRHTTVGTRRRATLPAP